MSEWMSVCAVTDNSDITSLGKCELYPLKWEYETFVVCYLYNNKHLGKRIL